MSWGQISWQVSTHLVTVFRSWKVYVMKKNTFQWCATEVNDMLSAFEHTILLNGIRSLLVFIF